MTKLFIINWKLPFCQRIVQNYIYINVYLGLTRLFTKVELFQNLRWRIHSSLKAIDKHLKVAHSITFDRESNPDLRGDRRRCFHYTTLTAQCDTKWDSSKMGHLAIDVNRCVNHVPQNYWDVRFGLIFGMEISWWEKLILCTSAWPWKNSDFASDHVVHTMICNKNLSLHVKIIINIQCAL